MLKLRLLKKIGKKYVLWKLRPCAKVAISTFPNILKNRNVLQQHNEARRKHKWQDGSIKTESVKVDRTNYTQFVAFQQTCPLAALCD